MNGHIITVPLLRRRVHIRRTLSTVLARRGSYTILVMEKGWDQRRAGVSEPYQGTVTIFSCYDNVRHWSSTHDFFVHILHEVAQKLPFPSLFEHRPNISPLVLFHSICAERRAKPERGRDMSESQSSLLRRQERFKARSKVEMCSISTIRRVRP